MEENENKVPRLFWVKGVKCSDLLEEMSVKELVDLSAWLGALKALVERWLIRT